MVGVLDYLGKLGFDPQPLNEVAFWFYRKLKEGEKADLECARVWAEMDYGV